MSERPLGLDAVALLPAEGTERACRGRVGLPPVVRMELGCLSKLYDCWLFLGPSWNQKQIQRPENPHPLRKFHKILQKSQKKDLPLKNIQVGIRISILPRVPSFRPVGADTERTRGRPGSARVLLVLTGSRRGLAAAFLPPQRASLAAAGTRWEDAPVAWGLAGPGEGARLTGHTARAALEPYRSEGPGCQAQASGLGRRLCPAGSGQRLAPAKGALAGSRGRCERGSRGTQGSLCERQFP